MLNSSLPRETSGRGREGRGQAPTRGSEVAPTPSQAASHAGSLPVGSGDVAPHSEEEPVCLCLPGEHWGARTPPSTPGC